MIFGIYSHKSTYWSQQDFKKDMSVRFDITTFSFFPLNLGQSGISHHEIKSAATIFSSLPPSTSCHKERWAPSHLLERARGCLLTLLLSFTHTVFYKFQSAVHTTHYECTVHPRHLRFWRPLWCCMNFGYYASKCFLLLHFSFWSDIIGIFKISKVNSAKFCRRCSFRLPIDFL